MKLQRWARAGRQSGMTLSQLAHLKLEVSAGDRRMLTFQPNVSNHAVRANIRHWRHAYNAGTNPGSAFEPCWWRWFGR